MSVGMPQALWLQQFGQFVRDAFGEVPYQVGSSLSTKAGWRDVDVRVILDDAAYQARGFGDPANPHSNPIWVATVLAWSSFGRELTSLPIDFQIQQQTRANAEFAGPRSALFVVRTWPEDRACG